MVSFMLFFHPQGVGGAFLNFGDIHARHGVFAVDVEGPVGTVEVIVGNDVSVGHNAIIHGAIIGNDVLVGMGAVVMDNAVVPDGTIIAAGAVVLAGAVLEPGIWAGVPARKVKDASETIHEKARANALHYLDYKKWYE